MDMQISPSLDPMEVVTIYLAGLVPVAGDVTALAIGESVHGIGTDGSEWHIVKRASGIKVVELE
jgi:hypothetical protein